MAKATYLTYHMGACAYCGQAIGLDGTYDSPAEANAAATDICKCAEAAAERSLKKEIREAKDKILYLFGEGARDREFEPIKSQETMDFMEIAVELVAREHIDNLTINSLGEYKAVIARNSKGKIKVSRSETHSSTLE